MIELLVFGILAGLALYKKEEIVQVVEEKLDSWTNYDDLFKKYASMYNLDWRMLKAISLNESDLGKDESVAYGIENPTDIENSKSSDGLSWGLMQVTVTTGRDFDATCSAVKLNNPEYSVRLASQFIASLKKQFNVNDVRYTEWIVKSYNQGAGNTKKEIKGLISGYANEYWSRYQRNYKRVLES